MKYITKTIKYDFVIVVFHKRNNATKRICGYVISVLPAKIYHVTVRFNWFPLPSQPPIGKHSTCIPVLSLSGCMPMVDNSLCRMTHANIMLNNTS